MIKTYTYKIKPNKALERKFEEQVSVCRFVYNVAKECREDSYKKGVSINYFDLSKQLTDAKKEHIWLKQVHSQTLQAVLERLEAGYKKFFFDSYAKLVAAFGATTEYLFITLQAKPKCK